MSGVISPQQANEFADVKSPGDIEKLAKDDPPRYVKRSEQQRRTFDRPLRGGHG